MEPAPSYTNVVEYYSLQINGNLLTGILLPTFLRSLQPLSSGLSRNKQLLVDFVHMVKEGIRRQW